MGFFVACSAEADEAFRAVGGEQPGLPPLMRDDIRPTRAAALAGRFVTAQGRMTRQSGANLVIAVERHVEEHAEEDEPDGARTATEGRQRGQRPWHVQHSHARPLLWLRAAKVAHRRDRIDAASMDAVPRQVINVYQNARGPWEQRLASKNW
jgi:hypothetical protein